MRAAACAAIDVSIIGIPDGAACGFAGLAALAALAPTPFFAGSFSLAATFDFAAAGFVADDSLDALFFFAMM
jgi:hypothetical protein